MRDPYQLLGVSRTASEAEIKKAYRRLAKAHHPDQNQGDSKAQARFSEVNQAYEVVGDKEKRAKFDRGEIDGDGKPRFAGMGSGAGGFRSGPQGFEFHSGQGAGPRRGAAGFDPSDLFADLFGSMRGAAHPHPPPRGADAGLTLSVPLKEAILGGKARLKLPSGKAIDLTIPPATEDGQTMRLKGQGLPSASGGEAGDALVTIHVEPHPLFKRDGGDLRLDLPITLDEAVLGAKVRVPTLEGPVDLAIAAGSNSGRTLRLRSKGAFTGTMRGDLLVKLIVMLPQGDEALTLLAENLRSQHSYRVRGDEFDS